MTRNTAPVGRFTSERSWLKRDGESIALFRSPDLAAAMADVLNGQVLLDVGNERADEIAGVLWP